MLYVYEIVENRAGHTTYSIYINTPNSRVELREYRQRQSVRERMSNSLSDREWVNENKVFRGWGMEEHGVTGVNERTATETIKQMCEPANALSWNGTATGRPKTEPTRAPRKYWRAQLFLLLKFIGKFFKYISFIFQFAHASHAAHAHTSIEIIFDYDKYIPYLCVICANAYKK